MLNTRAAKTRSILRAWLKISFGWNEWIISYANKSLNASLFSRILERGVRIKISSRLSRDYFDSLATTSNHWTPRSLRRSAKLKSVRKIFKHALRSCLNLVHKFCYAPFLPTFRYQNPHLAGLNSGFGASIGQKMDYNKFPQPNLNSF